MFTPFDKLDIVELKTIISSLRSGTDYLKRNLTAKQFVFLLKKGALDKQQKKFFNIRHIEWVGQASIVINTVITGIFGAWLGFHGFAGLKISSTFQFKFLGVLTFLLCGLFAFFSFKNTYKTAKQVKINQKILNVQHKVTLLLIEKLQHSEAHLVKEMNQLIKNLTKNLKSVNKWPYIANVDEFKQRLPNLFELIKAITSTYPHHITTHLETRSALILNDLSEKLTDSASMASASKKSSRLQGLFIALLKSKPPALPKISFWQWLKQNRLTLLVGFFPTLFGCFGSMFVFLSGGPDVAKSFGFYTAFKIITHPTHRVIEFISAVLLTMYLGSSFAYNNYKLFNRNSKLEQTNKKIAKLDKKVAELERSIKNYRHIIHYLTTLFQLYEFIDALDIIDKSSQA